MGGLQNKIDTSTDDWILPCSDEEMSKDGYMEGELWVPESTEFVNLYSAIEKSGTLPLEWKCHGRRLPSPITSNEDNMQIPQSNDDSAMEKSSFDFTDEMSSLRLRVRREGEDTLRGSAKKKTSSFDGILSNMMRHKRIQQLEREADNQ